MSCFIVSDKNINTLATYISDLTMRNSTNAKKLCREIMEAVGSDLLTGELLAKRLHGLNAVAFFDRYGEEVAGSVYYEREDTKNLFQVAKYLDCLLYQCFEGETPQDPLYKALEKVRSYLCSEAVSQSAEYIKAEEGIKMLIDQCPKCKDYGLRGVATIDMIINYDGKYFSYDEDGNTPSVDSFYCFECGETFTLKEVETHAKNLMKGLKDD